MQSMTTPKLRNPIVAAVAVCLCVAGCATPGGGPGNADSGCDPRAAALVGGVIGALLGGGSNRLKGAAIGAGLASLACVALNYNSRQTKTAAQVQQDYMASNRGQLPTRSAVTRYETNLDSGGVVRPGNRMVVNSEIEVVQGTADNNPVIEEELRLSRPDGRELKRIRKKANANEGAGGFSTTFSLSMPEGVPQGQYPIQTVLYLNGQQVVQ